MSTRGGKASRDRGTLFERRVASLFRCWIPESRRRLQYQKGTHNPDVWAPPFYIECKYRKSKSKSEEKNWLHQVSEKATLWGDGIPIVVWRIRRKEIMVTMSSVIARQLSWWSKAIWKDEFTSSDRVTIRWSQFSAAMNKKYGIEKGESDE